MKKCKRKRMISTKFKMLHNSRRKKEDNGKGKDAVGEVNIGVIVQNYSFYVHTCLHLTI